MQYIVPSNLAKECLINNSIFKVPLVSAHTLSVMMARVPKRNIQIHITSDCIYATGTVYEYMSSV